jgi:hypothetical protein
MVYLYLCRCARNATGRAWPSLNKLAHALRISKNTILTAIKNLVEQSWLRKAIRWFGKHNLYILGAGAEEVTQKSGAALSLHRYRGEIRTHRYAKFPTAILNGHRHFVKLLQGKWDFLKGWVVQFLYNRYQTNLCYSTKRKVKDPISRDISILTRYTHIKDELRHFFCTVWNKLAK